MSAFDEVGDGTPFNGVCGCHSRVIPAESYAAIENADERLRAISRLQQKALALESQAIHQGEVYTSPLQPEQRLRQTFEDADSPGKTSSDAAVYDSSTKRRLLVVDDNRDAGRTMAILLQLQGYEVRTASDGLQALDIVAEFQPEVILMDIGMPNLDGYEATRRIRQMPEGKDAFIVAVTGWGRPSDSQQSADAGCSAHLVKPVEFAELQRLLDNCNAMS
jgi:CheY-like chemotaxis protein